MEFTGGHIAVACRVAKTMALGDGGPMRDEQLLRALCTELRKVGANVAASRWEKARTTGGDGRWRIDDHKK